MSCGLHVSSASWGPWVVEAIQTRNVTCLAKKPIVRDPHIFALVSFFFTPFLTTQVVGVVGLSDKFSETSFRCVSGEFS